jgi:CheY-like chemotaxis protein
VPDLLLLDVMLRRIDGFALLKKLRADPRTSKLLTAPSRVPSA